MRRIQTSQRSLVIAVLAVLLVLAFAPSTLANQAEERGWTSSQATADASDCQVSPRRIFRENPNLLRVVHNEPNSCLTRATYTTHEQAVKPALEPGPSAGLTLEWPLFTAAGAMIVAAGISVALRHRPQTTG